MEPYHPPVKAPELPLGVWLNTHEPPKIRGSDHRIVLIDIFDFTCINCIRTLPYLRFWQERYQDLGLSVIGIHTPEFQFAHDPETVKAGIGRLGIRWPVFLDNHQELWTAYANRYWPSLYLLDQQGRIRYRHVGEGGYQQIERRVQELLLEVNPQAKLPELLMPLRPEDAEGTACAPISPEIHLGAIDGLVDDSEKATSYHIPAQLKPNKIYLNGTWQVSKDGITLTGNQGEITVRYQAARVHSVFAPKPLDDLGLPFNSDPLYIEVLQDGKPLERDCFGQDLQAHAERARLRVDMPRLYDLVENTEVATHELRLLVQSAGLTFYAFAFGSCMNRSEVHPRSKE